MISADPSTNVPAKPRTYVFLAGERGASAASILSQNEFQAKALRWPSRMDGFVREMVMLLVSHGPVWLEMSMRPELTMVFRLACLMNVVVR